MCNSSSAHLRHCSVSVAVKEYLDIYVLLLSVEHDRHSHKSSSGILSVSQRNGVIGVIRASPMIPDKHVATDARSCKAMRIDWCLKRVLISCGIWLTVQSLMVQREA